jgi:asparaginyl-tRNA synthetase
MTPVNKLSIKAAQQPANIGQTVTIQGWVRTRRDSKGGFSFLEINDGSTQGNLQIVAEAKLENYETEVKKLVAGCSVSVTGELRASPAKGQATELLAQQVSVHGWADSETYPLQKKGHTYEFLRTIAHLRPRTNTFGAVARLRNRVSNSIHQFFQERDFLYVHTPIITASDCEGAGELFKVTTLHLDKLAKSSSAIDYGQDFFGKPAYLTVSGQLNGETYACGLGKIYTFGPTFRAENSNTSRHLAEFWMVEPEVAFNDLNDNMALAEAFLKRIFSDVLNHCGEELKFFVERVEKTVVSNLEAILASEFERCSYTEAIKLLLDSGHKFEYPLEWGRDMQSEHERYLTETIFKKPVIVYDYPRTLKPFYMRCNEDGKTVRAMDVLVPGVGEIIGGSQREERLDLLETRMREQHLDPAAYWWYADLRRYGTVPHAGFGLGLERVLQFISGLGNIRDVIPFPRTPGSADF